MPDPDLVGRIIEFLNDIGIKVLLGGIAEETFLPGIEVVDGVLIVDRGKLKYPGDLLHEAGHLAVSPATERMGLSGEVELAEAAPHLVELEAILWSYAACLYLDIDPRVVFHEHGYHGRSEGILLNFEMGLFLGVHGLEAAGMTLSRREAAESDRQPFPVMQKWLKD
jgi:hypothetical protein